MRYFEIRIWGNPNGFKELTTTESTLFTDEDLRRRGLDSVDILCNEYYSLFYTNNCYIISLHFMLPSSIKSKVGFRDDSTILSVVIKREIKLSNTAEVLQLMKERYLTLVSDELPHIDELGKRLSTKTPEFEEIVRPHLSQDLDQLMININGNSTQSGVVLYRNTDDLIHYLDTPCRKEYKGYFVVYFAPLEESNKFLNYRSIDVAPQYDFFYDVLFPEYKGNAPIALVQSLDDKIDVQCQKEDCNDIQLQGILKDNITNWQVKRSEDKTQYIIGLRFMPIVSTYKIVCCDKQGKLLDCDLNWLKSNFGQIDYRQHCISFSGHVSFSDLMFESKDPKVGFEFKWNENAQRFEFVVVFYNVYNVLALHNYILDNYHFKPLIQIKKKNRKTNVSGQAYFKYEGIELDFDIIIQESEAYEECSFPMNTNITDIRLKERKCNRISFIVDGDLAQKEFSRKAAKIILFNEENKKEISITDEKPYIDLVNRKLSYYYTFKFRGFHSINDLKIDSRQNEYLLSFKPTLIMRVKSVRSYIFCLIIGVILGIVATIGIQYLLQSDNLETLNVDQQTVETPTKEKDEKAAAKTETKTGTKTETETEKSDSNFVKLQDDLKVLKGISYTNDDIKRITKFANDNGLYKKCAESKITIAKACLNHLCEKKKVNEKVLTDFLNSNDTILSNDQKKFIDEILGDEALLNAYGSNKAAYASMKELMKALKSATNPK